MSDEVVIVKGRLGWGNPGSGTAHQFEVYGPGDRWAPARPGQKVQSGDLMADALAEAGATEGHQVLVIAIPRFGNPAVLDALEKAIRDGIAYVLPTRPVPDRGRRTATDEPAVDLDALRANIQAARDELTLWRPDAELGDEDYYAPVDPAVLAKLADVATGAADDLEATRQRLAAAVTALEEIVASGAYPEAAIARDALAALAAVAPAPPTPHREPAPYRDDLDADAESMADSVCDWMVAGNVNKAADAAYKMAGVITDLRRPAAPAPPDPMAEHTEMWADEFVAAAPPTEPTDEALCRHCGRRIWRMGDYQGWVHADSWAKVCDTATHHPVAEPPVAPLPAAGPEETKP